MDFACIPWQEGSKEKHKKSGLLPGTGVQFRSSLRLAGTDKEVLLPDEMETSVKTTKSILGILTITATLLVCTMAQAQQYSLSTLNGAYVAVPFSASLNITNNCITVECWFNRQVLPSGSDTWNSLVSTEPYGTTFAGWDLRFANLSPRGSINTTIQSTVDLVDIAGSGQPTTNQWHHYAMQFDGTNYLVWMDGNLIFSTNLVGQIIPTTNPIYMGCQNSGYRPFLGYIAEVRVSNIPRYYTAFVPQTRFATDSNTVALYHFDEGQGTAVADSSGNGNNGTVQGTGAWSTNVPTYSLSFLTNGLIAYYPFNGNANDASGNGNNGTVQGATLTTDRFGIPNSAYYFDGVSSRIQIPETVFGPTNEEVTISAWIATDNGPYTGEAYILEKGSVNGEMKLFIDSGQFAFGPVLATPEGFYASSPMRSNSVVNLVGVYTQGQVVSLYVNGVLANSISVPNDTLWVDQSGYPLVSAIGIYDYTPAPYNGFRGVIDDVRIYNRALSSNEVAQLYDYESQATNPPTITGQPQSLVVNANDTASFGVTASGAQPLSFQWSLNSTNILGATSSI